VVQIGVYDLRRFAKTSSSSRNHGCAAVNAYISEPVRPKELAKATVTASEIQDAISGCEDRPERGDELGAVAKVPRGVSVRFVAPTVGDIALEL
jgi:hypothetical protein